MKKTDFKTLSNKQRQLRKRILNVSFENRLSHLGSCLSSVDLIEEIYNIKRKDDIFVLSNGHAGIALYVVLEKHGYIKNLDTIKKLHIHPDRNEELGIHVSTGSLGQGLPIALGMALADRTRTVYCMISDGESTEGSIWETVRVASDKNITNLKIILNANGWGAYDKVNVQLLKRRFKAFGFNIKEVNGHDLKAIKESLVNRNYKKPYMIFAHTIVDQFSFLRGQDAHYYIMKDEDYISAMETLT